MPKPNKDNIIQIPKPNKDNIIQMLKPNKDNTYSDNPIYEMFLTGNQQPSKGSNFVYVFPVERGSGGYAGYCYKLCQASGSTSTDTGNNSESTNSCPQQGSPPHIDGHKQIENDLEDPKQDNGELELKECEFFKNEYEALRQNNLQNEGHHDQQPQDGENSNENSKCEETPETVMRQIFVYLERLTCNVQGSKFKQENASFPTVNAYPPLSGNFIRTKEEEYCRFPIFPPAAYRNNGYSLAAGGHHGYGLALAAYCNQGYLMASAACGNYGCGYSFESAAHCDKLDDDLELEMVNIDPEPGRQNFGPARERVVLPPETLELEPIKIGPDFEAILLARGVKKAKIDTVASTTVPETEELIPELGNAESSSEFDTDSEADDTVESIDEDSLDYSLSSYCDQVASNEELDDDLELEMVNIDPEPGRQNFGPARERVVLPPETLELEPIKIGPDFEAILLARGVKKAKIDTVASTTVPETEELIPELGNAESSSEFDTDSEADDTVESIDEDSLDYSLSSYCDQVAINEELDDDLELEVVNIDPEPGRQNFGPARERVVLPPETLELEPIKIGPDFEAMLLARGVKKAKIDTVASTTVPETEELIPELGNAELDTDLEAEHDIVESIDEDSLDYSLSSYCDQVAINEENPVIGEGGSRTVNLDCDGTESDAMLSSLVDVLRQLRDPDDLSESSSESEVSESSSTGSTTAGSTDSGIQDALSCSSVATLSDLSVNQSLSDDSSGFSSGQSIINDDESDILADKTDMDSDHTESFDQENQVIDNSEIRHTKQHKIVESIINSLVQSKHRIDVHKLVRMIMNGGNTHNEDGNYDPAESGEKREDNSVRCPKTLIVQKFSNRTRLMTDIHLYIDDWIESAYRRDVSRNGCCALFILRTSLGNRCPCPAAPLCLLPASPECKKYLEDVKTEVKKDLVVNVLGHPELPSNVRVKDVENGVLISWELSPHLSGKIVAHSVSLAVNTETANTPYGDSIPLSSTDGELVFTEVYSGTRNEVYLPNERLGEAYLDTTLKPAIVFRIAAKNMKGLGPAVQVRWLQNSFKLMNRLGNSADRRRISDSINTSNKRQVMDSINSAAKKFKRDNI